MNDATYTYACLPSECWLARFSENSCEGRMDRAHLIPKQQLKHVAVCFRGDVSLYDERLWVPACRFHHGQFDNYRLTVPRESLPADLVGLAGELALTWYLERRYPIRVAA